MPRTWTRVHVQGLGLGLNGLERGIEDPILVEDLILDARDSEISVRVLMPEFKYWYLVIFYKIIFDFLKNNSFF